MLDSIIAGSKSSYGLMGHLDTLMVLGFLDISFSAQVENFSVVPEKKK